MSENFGFFKFPRELLTNSIFKSFSYEYRHIFLVIMANVAFKKTVQNDHGVLIELMPGQFLTTFRELEQLCNEKEIDKSKIERALKKFFHVGFSRQETRHTKTIITITEPSICRLIETENETRNETKTRQDRDIKEECIERKEEIHNDLAVVNSYKIFPLHLKKEEHSHFEEKEDITTIIRTSTQCTHSENKISELEIKQKEKSKSHNKSKTKKNQEPAIKKIFFREKVSLTQEQYDKLLSDHGEKLLECMLNKLNVYKGTHEKEYKSDYFAMKEGGWVVKGARKKIKCYSEKFEQVNFHKLKEKNIYFRVYSEYLHLGNDKIYFKDDKCTELIQHSLKKLEFFN